MENKILRSKLRSILFRAAGDCAPIPVPHHFCKSGEGQVWERRNKKLHFIYFDPIGIELFY